MNSEREVLSDRAALLSSESVSGSRATVVARLFLSAMEVMLPQPTASSNASGPKAAHAWPGDRVRAGRRFACCVNALPRSQGDSAELARVLLGRLHDLPDHAAR